MTPKEQLRQISTLNQRIDQRLKLIEYYMEQAELHVEREEQCRNGQAKQGVFRDKRSD